LSNEYSHVATVAFVAYPTEKLKEALVTTPFDELQLELAEEVFCPAATAGAVCAANVRMLMSKAKKRKGCFLDFCS
jgi:hypothetical protein